jgi:hypothetical protein
MRYGVRTGFGPSKSERGTLWDPFEMLYRNRVRQQMSFWWVNERFPGSAWVNCWAGSHQLLHPAAVHITPPCDYDPMSICRCGRNPDVRVAAINALGTKPSIDSAAIAVLLGIDEPYVVRDAAVAVFEQRGCDEICTSATLDALEAMWGGRPLFEMQLEATHPSPTGKTIVARMREQTEQRYLALANRNPCATRTALRTDYAHDTEFAEGIQVALGPC